LPRVDLLRLTLPVLLKVQRVALVSFDLRFDQRPFLPQVKSNLFLFLPKLLCSFTHQEFNLILRLSFFDMLLHGRILQIGLHLLSRLLLIVDLAFNLAFEDLLFLLTLKHLQV